MAIVVFYATLFVFLVMVLTLLQSTLWKLILLGGIALTWRFSGLPMAGAAAAILSIMILLKSKLPTMSRF